MAKEVIRVKEGTAREEEETRKETKQREEEEVTKGTKHGEECDRKMVMYTIGDYFIIVLIIVIFESLII